jgi:hypothetical protein
MPSTANPQKSPNKFLSFNWMRGVADDSRISVIHRLALIRLCMHRHNDGRCNPGYDAVATELSVDRTTIFRAIDVGVRFGWLAGFSRHGGRARRNFIFTFPTQSQKKRNNSRRRATVQQSQAGNCCGPQQSQGGNPTVAGGPRLTVAGWQSNSCRRNQQDADLASNFDRNGQRERSKVTGTENGGRKSPKNPPDQMGKKKETGGGTKTSANPAQRAKSSSHDGKTAQRAADDGGDGFADFWRLYPRHDAKEAARKAFARAIKDGIDPETMIVGAQRYAITEQVRIACEHTPNYTAHAATWLNGRRWEDPLPPGTVVDNETGNVVAVEQPPPKRAGGQKTWAEVADEFLAEVGNAVIR